MKRYRYIARDLSGMRREGDSQAGCSDDVLSWLREQGFTPISVEEVSAGTATKKVVRRRSRRKRIKSAELAALCWQLTTMVEGGIPITEAISIVAEDIENLQLQEILKQISENLLRGETFSNSLARFPNAFNRLSCALVLAGETSGNLAGALHRLAEYFDGRDKLAKKLKGAMAYPIFVFTFIVLIVIFIMAFIVPRFTMIFDQIGGQLPAFTRAFMGFYDMLRYNLVYIIGFISLVIVSGVLTFKTTKGHYLFCKIALAAPLFGRILAQAFLVVFCKTMATLLSAGVSVLDVFDILHAMTGNDIIKDAIARTKEQIVEGSSISTSLGTSGFFPNMVTKMIDVGEKSGSLSRVLDRTANYYERKVDTAISTLTTLLEPIMIVVVGSIVLVVVLALYLPIFTMSDISK